MSAVVLETHALSRRFGGLAAVDAVSIACRHGEVHAVIGPNGAGKSTLINLLSGDLEPSQGTVRLFGRTPKQLNGGWQRVGYVPQTAHIDVRFPIRVFDLVLMGRYGRIGLIRRPGPGDREATWRALERAGIADLARRPIGRLSGGQRQRALVARALATEPELLLLDEPTTGVDVGATEGLFDLLTALHQQGVTILVVSHDVGVVAQHVDQVVCVSRRLIAHGRPEEVLNGDVLECMYGPQAALLDHGALPHLVVRQHDQHEG